MGRGRCRGRDGRLLHFARDATLLLHALSLLFPSGVQNGELPVLPLSIPGAVTFARLPSGDPSYLSGSDWFVYKVGLHPHGHWEKGHVAMAAVLYGNWCVGVRQRTRGV